MSVGGHSVRIAEQVQAGLFPGRAALRGSFNSITVSANGSLALEQNWHSG